MSMCVKNVGRIIMTKQLILNRIDMLDQRAIGLKCLFWSVQSPPTVYVSNKHILSNNFIGVLHVVYPDKEFPFVGITDDGLRGSSEYCRIAQGDKTAYDGKGQPVPDGVIVEYWRRGTEIEGRDRAERIDWDSGIIYYQVQEMPVEQPLADLANKQEPLGADFQKVIDDNFFELAEATPVEHVLYKDGDANLPQPILDMNGQVALACCKVCGEYEAGLDNPCIPRLPVEQEEKIKLTELENHAFDCAFKSSIKKVGAAITTKLHSEIVECLKDARQMIESEWCGHPVVDDINRILAELGEGNV